MALPRRLPLGLALVLLGACGQDSTTPSVAANAFNLQADQVGVGVQQVLTSNGIRTAVLYSDTTLVFEGDRRFDLIGVKVVFYDESGSEGGTLTSKRGDYDLDRDIFVARGDVVLVSRQPGGERRLETEELHYDLAADSLSTTKPFTLNDAGQITTGTSFRSDSNFRTWEVTGAETQSSVGEGGLSF